ncbi:hypothetical protein GGR57DRAFT_513813 [Xylariaceae sp. FL1272]|nr:hypothetical protein GGR57DRAFT_513813 [Xylariaceae sp. FL1272]
MKATFFLSLLASLFAMVVLAVPYDTGVQPPNVDAEPMNNHSSVVAPLQDRSFPLQSRSGAFTASCKNAFIQNPSGQYDLVADCLRKDGHRMCSVVNLDRCVAVENGQIVAKNMWVDGGGLAKGHCTSCTFFDPNLRCNCASNALDLNTVIGNDDGYLTCFEHPNRFKSDACR